METASIIIAIIAIMFLIEKSEKLSCSNTSSHRSRRRQKTKAEVKAYMELQIGRAIQNHPPHHINDLSEGWLRSMIDLFNEDKC